ncbi:MAG: hypothetical protein FWD17_19860 [Polyangiaceae bacterium]|nr:hypothetical protein [Polyangiaceae bacterium]
MTDPQIPRTTHAKLVTIVTASELWPQLEVDLPRLGVSAYTWMDVSGRGGHGLRHPSLFLSGNVRVEVIVSAEVAQTIFEHLAAHYEGREVAAFAVDVVTLVR